MGAEGAWLAEMGFGGCGSMHVQISISFWPSSLHSDGVSWMASRHWH